MPIFTKFEDIQNTLAGLSRTGQNPLDVRFDEIRSPVEGFVGGKRVLLFGTSN